MKKKNRDWGKPYIRRANGKETSDSFRETFRLAFYTVRNKPFYVLVQRGVKNEVMACGASKAELLRGFFGCYFTPYTVWTNRLKLNAQGREQEFNRARKNSRMTRLARLRHRARLLKGGEP